MSRYALSDGFVRWVEETFPPPPDFMVFDGWGGRGPVLARDLKGNVLRFQQAGRDHWLPIALAPNAKEAASP